MKKRRLRMLLVVLVLLASLEAECLAAAKKNQEPELDSQYAAIIRGSDGALLFGKEEQAETPNASTTKMMTALLTMSAASAQDIVTVSATAAKTPYGVMWMYAGEQIYVKDLLYAMLIRSCNDAAAALAEHIGGSQTAFVEMMNQKAEQMGLEHTHYVNPHGLHEEGHYSSAYDLCRLQRACYNIDVYRKIIGRKSCSFYDVDHTRGFYFHSTDLMLDSKWAEKGFKGGKTGYVEEAGECFAGIYEKDHETYFFTLLGASSKALRWEDTEKMIRYIEKNL